MELLYLLVVVIVFAIVGAIVTASRKNQSQTETKEKPVGPKKYFLRNFLFDKRELPMYNILRRALGDTYLVLSKVRIEDFVKVNKYGRSRQEAFGLRNRIKSRHVDFLICDKTSRPVMAVELDGASHNNPKRRERDERLDKIYKDIGLSVRHIRVGSDFEKEAEAVRQHLDSLK